MQISAMNGGVGGAIALHRLHAQCQSCQLLPRHGIAGAQGFRNRNHLLQWLLQAPGLQAPHNIGAQLNTCPDLGKPAGGFRR